MNVSADKVRPATGVVKVDTKNGKIMFLKPAQEEASLKDLFKGGASSGELSANFCENPIFLIPNI